MPAWDALWRQIIADLGDVLGQPSIDDSTEGSDRADPTSGPGTGEV